MTTHIKTLGVLHIVLGSIGLLMGVLGLFFFGGIAAIAGMTGEEGSWIAAPILGFIGIAALILALVLSLPSLIVGIGLVRMRAWSRILGVVVSALNLVHVPIGTAVGIYGLWVLVSPETERLLSETGTAMRPLERVG